MKKLFLFIILIAGAFYYYNNSNPLKPTDISNISSTSNNEVIYVKGVVKSNFKILFKGVYELKDLETNESIMITSESDLPKIGKTVTVKLKKSDLITVNDKTFSLYQEVE